MIKKNKVVFFINNLQVGGAERVVTTLLHHYNHEDKEVSLLVIEPIIEYPLDEKIKVTSLWKKPLSKNKALRFLQLGWTLFKLLGYLQNHKVTKLISQLSIVNYLNIIAKRLGGGHQCYISFHCAFQYYSKPTIKNRINKSLIRRLYPKSDLMISVSKNVMESYRKEIGLGIPFVTIDNPFDFDYIETGERLTIDLPKKYIAILARLDPIKRHSDLIKAYAKLNDNVKQDIDLCIIGEGPQKASLKALTAQLGLDQKVHFLGQLPNPFAVLKKAEVLCLSSENEAFPMALVEAMICKTAVIASDCNYGPDEILDHGECGLLYPVGDIEKLKEGLEFLVTNHRERAEYIEKAYKKVKQFDVQVVGETYWEQVISR